MADDDVITESEAQKLTEDLIWGTQAIADEIGKSLTETQYLIRTNVLPIGRLGKKTIFASRRQLRRRLTPKLARTTASDKRNGSALPHPRESPSRGRLKAREKTESPDVAPLHGGDVRARKKSSMSALDSLVCANNQEVPANARSQSYWSSAIRKSWQKSITGIIETGALSARRRAPSLIGMSSRRC